MKKILIVIDFPLDNLNSGNKMYVFWMLKKLYEKGHSISVVSKIAELNMSGQLDSKISPLLADYNISISRLAFLKRYIVLKLFLRRKKNVPASFWAVNWNLKRKSTGFDELIVNYPWNYKAVEGFRGKKILWVHDSFLNRNLLLNLNWMSLGAKGLKVCYNKFDKVVHSNYFEYLSESKYYNNIYYQRLPVKQEKIRKRRLDLNSVRIGFIGSDNEVNRRTLDTILSSWNVIARKDYHLILAGSITRYALEIDNRLDITLMGYLDDINEFYSSVDIVYSTLGRSTGIKIKEIEALAKGVRIIADKWTRSSYDRSIDIHSSFLCYEGLTNAKLVDFLQRDFLRSNYCEN